MKQISNMVIRLKGREKYFLSFSYAANVMVTCILIMIATGIQNITNESLSSSDAQQMQSIFASVISVSIITIAFFQWIISMQFVALFNSRKQFNNNMRLMGAPDKDLLKIYLKEMVRMQPLSMVFGVVLGEIVFWLLAKRLETSVKYIAPAQIICACLIHIIVISVCVMITFRKLTRTSVVDEIRGVNKAKKKKKNKVLYIVKLIVGVAVLAISVLAAVTGERGSDQQSYGWFGMLIAIFLNYDLIVLLFHKIVSAIGKKVKNRSVIFSEAISIGYLEKSKASGTMILFSSMMFLGLNMLYANVRVCGSDTVEQRVHYMGSAWFAEMQTNDDAFMETEKGLKFKTKNEGSSWYILGVDSDFEGSYEDIVLDKRFGDDYENMRSQLNNPEFDGIYMPNMYISQDDLGKEMTININGVDVKFHIAGGYYSNNFAHISFFVSKSYLAKSLGLKEDDYNILYFKDEQTWNSFETNEKVVLQSFEDIRNESYEKAVSGTSLVEMVAMVIILCAIISLVNFIMISSREDCFDIARLRGIGLGQGQVRTIYVLESLIPVVLSTLLAIPASLLFARIGCDMVFDPGYYQRGLVADPIQMVALLILFSVISVLVRLVALRKAMVGESYVGLLREVKE
ncbi:MAG: hypothetical protein IJF03_03335 [Lachnospiraceae bacterium]|nr:hypothetical protein [Lachnospiraceae bacterium]